MDNLYTYKSDQDLLTTAQEVSATFPARSCVEVARLPKDVKIEIEAIAVRR